jgi:hypothetical protein
MSTDKDIDILKSVYNEIISRNYTTQEKILDTVRKECEFFVYNSLRNNYGSIFEKAWNEMELPDAKISDRTILLVERRCHPNVLFCLQNVVYYAKGFSITIICSETNIDYIKSCLGKHVKNVRIIPIFKDGGTPEEGKQEYNELLQNADFWKLFSQTYILTIETDCYLKKPLPDSIFQYDYVASKWPWNIEQPGGGGLSLRKRDVMIKICETFPNKLNAQDCYISEGIQKLGYTYPNVQETMNYFSEFIPGSSFCGFHQWWTGLQGHSFQSIKDNLTCII